MLLSDGETIAALLGLGSDDVKEILKSLSQNLISNRALHGGGLHLLTLLLLFVVLEASSLLHGFNVASVVHV